MLLLHLVGMVLLLLCRPATSGKIKMCGKDLFRQMGQICSSFQSYQRGIMKRMQISDNAGELPDYSADDSFAHGNEVWISLADLVEDGSSSMQPHSSGTFQKITEKNYQPQQHHEQNDVNRDMKTMQKRLAEGREYYEVSGNDVAARYKRSIYKSLLDECCVKGCHIGKLVAMCI